MSCTFELSLSSKTSKQMGSPHLSFSLNLAFIAFIGAWCDCFVRCSLVWGVSNWNGSFRSDVLWGLGFLNEDSSFVGGVLKFPSWSVLLQGVLITCAGKEGNVIFFHCLLCFC